MIKISVQAAHEQNSPSDLLDHVTYMDNKGIQRCWTSDHYMPWWHSGASGGAAWPWLGAALAKTRNIAIGTGVTAPILRYHPAIVAQVFSTLSSMFPNRVFLGLGKGEALNEITSGNPWPSNQERHKRLKEAIKLIKKLWKEDWVTFDGEYYWVKDSNLYTKPKGDIPIYIAGNGPQSAQLAGEEGDGFITTSADREILKNRLIPAIQKGLKKSGKDYEKFSRILFMHTSYDEDRNKALESLRFWRGVLIKAFFELDIHDPRKIEENCRVIQDDSLEKNFFVISDAEEAIKKIKQYKDLGFTEIVLTNSSPSRYKLIDLLSDKVIPAVNLQ